MTSAPQSIHPSTDDLGVRCQELLDWSKTGLLAGGKGGAVRALADRLRETVGDHYALSLAESQTKDDAMRFVVSHATLKARNADLEAALSRISTPVDVAALQARVEELEKLALEAALFLEVGAMYAPDESAHDRNTDTGETLETQGLATSMKSAASGLRAALNTGQPK
jgi:hypothetical protein